jgi:cyclase
MFRPRIIPVLLLHQQNLVKSRGFHDYTYIGDPINAVRIFNEQRADELIFLDIIATKNKRLVSIDLLKKIAEETLMPFSAGGGISELSQIREIISAGAEKVVIGSYALVDPDFIKKASQEFGSSTITVCIDVKKDLLGRERVWGANGRKKSRYDPLAFAQLMEKNGAGEVIVQSIQNDGKMNGYDLALVKKIAGSLSIPTVALGGAGNLNDLKKAYIEANATGLAAGSLFVFYGQSKGVLINYPKTKIF